MRKIRLALVSFISIFTPILAFAQGNSSGGNACDFEITSIAMVFHLFGCILSVAVLPLLVTVAVVVFIIGVIKYISKGDESKSREEGQKFMLYGIIGLFVMVSIWGLVGIIQGTFGLGTNVLIPQLQGI
ncbi:MAG: hypothetical protein IT284_02680 [Bacteroidetes bacterium]|nr:hypothetical protein [Bacteroidota bacterium]